MPVNPINDELINSIAAKKVALTLDQSITDETANAYIGGRIDQAVTTTEHRGVLHNRVLERFTEMMSAAIEARDLLGSTIKVGDSVVVSEASTVHGEPVAGLVRGTVVAMRRVGPHDYAVPSSYEGVMVEVSTEDNDTRAGAHRADDVLVVKKEEDPST